jgi:hypothetical protein
MVNNMKASEALRKGSKMVEPVRGMIEEYQTGKCCALGMIGKAARGAASRYYEDFEWMWQRGTKLPCGCTDAMIMGGGALCVDRTSIEARIGATVVHLFNYHVMTEGDWTIDQIADWLDTLDPSNDVVSNEIAIPNKA